MVEHAKKRKADTQDEVTTTMETTVSVPMFTPVMAPKITSTSHEALVKWRKERNEYEEKIRTRVQATGEDLGKTLISVKNSFDERLLATWCKLRWKTSKDEITDDRILAEITQIIASVKNDTLPDIETLFGNELKMDLGESDVSERVLQYFKKADELIDEHGLAKCFDGSSGTKEKCKLLVASLEPSGLKEEVKATLRFQRPPAKEREDDLHDLILEKALEHERSFHRRKKVKRPDTKEYGRDTKERQSKPGTSGQDKKPVRKDKEKGFGGQKKTSGNGKPQRPPPQPCPKCNAMHWLSDCTCATEEEKVELRRQLRERKEAKAKVKRVKECLPADRRTLTLNDVLTVPYCADSGADRTIMSRGQWDELKSLDPTAEALPLSTPIECYTVGGHKMVATEYVRVKILIHTAAGPVSPSQPFDCLLLSVDEDEFILGQDILTGLGIDVNRQLEQLAGSPTEDDDDIDQGLPDVQGSTDKDQIKDVIDQMIERAVDQGFPVDQVDRLKTIVSQYDIWRLTLGPDPPARVPPMEIRLKPDAVPYKCKARRYPPHLSEFLREFNGQLAALGWVYENPKSRWACPVVPVRKPGGKEYRQTNDYRPVNAMTETIAGVMPNLPVALEHAAGKECFGLFDFMKGFWQLPLATESQEILSYMTDKAIYTPTRVPQGCSDAALHFQKTMEHCFAELLYESLLVWIDDLLLLYACDVPTYLDKMDALFRMVDYHGLKLSVAKSSLYQTKVKWCGKVIDAKGVSHDPKRIEALRQIPYPATAAELQQFLCATNWMRDSLIDYARVVRPLQERLDQALASGKRTKRVAAGIKIELTAEEKATFDQTKNLLADSATLTFPASEATVCLLTDASEYGWAAIVTQVQQWRPNVPVKDQSHELLICIGGTFTKAQLNWSVIEKEAYAIVAACERLEYLLLRPKGFKMFCDHRNLIHVFAPGHEVKKHVRGKLLRWAMKLGDYPYVIEHIDGTDNVWADMVSRWAVPRPAIQVRRIPVYDRVRRRDRRPPTIRPLDSDGFTWPTLEELSTIQSSTPGPANGVRSQEDDLLRVEGRLWVPATATQFIQRLCVIAHCGSQGHRGYHVMLNHLGRLFYVHDLATVVRRFLSTCLLCKHVKGGKVVPRPWSETIECQDRNEVLHWDFLYLGDSFGSSKYLLVLKDHATHFCELVVADSADSAVAAEAILGWHSRYGVPPLWVSDNGSHFKNEVIKELCRRLKSQQTFTLAYSPWINGSVERINRDILQVLRTMILEYKIAHHDWVYLIPMVQANLNHTPVPSLVNRSPAELFTALPLPTPLWTFYDPSAKTSVTIPSDVDKINDYLDRLRSSVRAMHRPVADQREAQRARNKKPAVERKAPNFAVGDYLLRSRVDEKRKNKLLVTWTGPYVVTQADSHSFRVKHLVTGDETDVHASRLKFYADSDLEVSDELLEHVSAQGIVLAVQQLKAHRWNADITDYEIRVRWRGLQEIEDSWEPLKALAPEISKLLQDYVGQSQDNDVQAFWAKTYARA